MEILKNLKSIKISLLLGVLLISNTLSATNYYVSKTGRDSNNGTNISTPFATIQQAANNVKPGETVFIRAGVYREEVDLSKSGTKSQPIIFTPYNNETVVLTTTDIISDWTKSAGNIYKAKFNADVTGPQGITFFYENELMQPAHWSNKGKNVNMLNGDEFAIVSSYTSTTITDPNLKGFANDYWNGAYVWVQTNSWSMRSRRITDFDGSTGRITFDGSVSFSAVDNKKYLIVDSYKALDAPGEWFFDNKTNELYFWAPGNSNPNTAKVELKVRKECINLNEHNYIHVKGIHFKGGDINMQGSSGVLLQGCNIKMPDWDFGPESNTTVVASLQLDGSNNIIRDNEIDGICVQFINLIGENNEIVNNYFHDTGYKNTYGSAVNFSNCGNGNLISHNTFYRTGSSAINGSGKGGYHFVIQYNEFNYTCLLSADVGAIGMANCSFNNSLIHHNVFYNMAAMSAGLYMDSMGADIVFHHNILYNGKGWGLKVNMPATNILCYNNTMYNPGIIDGMSATTNLSAKGVRFYNNMYNHIAPRLLSGGAVLEGNFWSLSRDMASNFIDADKGDFRLKSDSKAIDAGVEIENVTTGFIGNAPDAGALEYGEEMWKFGHNFTTPPSPKYNWYSVPFSNFIVNPSFEDDLNYWDVSAQTPTSLSVNSWNYKDVALGVAGVRSLELNPGDEVTQTIKGLSPSTLYKLTAQARILRTDLKMVKSDYASGSFNKAFFGNEYSLGGINKNEWLRFDNIDFGEGELFRSVEIGHTYNASINVEVRLDKLEGTLLASISLNGGSPVCRWNISGANIPEVTGNHSIYVIFKSDGGASDRVDRLRLLNTSSKDRAVIGIKDFDSSKSVKSEKIGYSYWSGEEGLIFKTGATNTTATVLINKMDGIANAYVENVSLMQVDVDQNEFRTNYIPGVIEAEDFDMGGQGIAYNVAELAVDENSYRSETSVDLETTSDINGAFQVNEFDGGDWLEYTVATVEDGFYDIQLRYASANSDVSPIVSLNGVILGIFSAKLTGSTEIWKTANISNINVEGGSGQILRIKLPAGQINLNYLKFMKKPKPIANFSVKLSAIVNEGIQFTNTSKNADSYVWNFGDGNTSDLANPVHAYSKIGTFSVVLTSTNKVGISTKTTNVTVNPLPISTKFTVKTVGVVTGELLQFTNQTSNADSYVWDFGDGNTSTLANPTHAYTALGTYKVVLAAKSESGTKTVSINIVVSLLPVSAQFSVKTTDVVTGESLTFANTSSNATSYSWSFGDGITSTSANPTHVYTELGTYTVKLTATSKAGSSSVSKSVAVTLLPVSAKFSVKTADVITGETLIFTNTSANATSYSWNFGDGTTSTLANPTHTYNNLGTYTVKLTATSQAGSSIVTKNVSVTLLPVSAKFSVKTTDVVTGESLTFANTSSNATSYIWNFGDGTTSTLANPSHTYTDLGTYTVKLTATSKAGTSSVSKSVAVTLLPVSAKFSVKTTDVVTGESLTFANTSSNATSYSWNFGDGTTSTLANPSHTYTDLGTYTVKLTATSKAGSSSVTKNVAITLLPVSAKFSVKTTDVVTGESLTFANTSSNATSYSWNFGDGTTSTLANPSHTYSSLGTYTVKLTATSKAGSSSVTKNVAVALLPVSAKFSVKTTDVVTGESLTFANTSSNATSYSWNFGDGTTSASTNPTHTYSTLGTYTVKLTATSKAGSSSVTKNVVVNIIPALANFLAKTGAETNEAIQFTNTSVGASTYSWDFGDGNSSSDANPSHAFANEGTYTVKLTVTNKAGSSTKSSTIKISAVFVPIPAVSKFSVKTTDVVTGEVLQFTNQSTDANSYEWNFGDGTTSLEVNPTHQYKDLGTYKVVLTATNDEGSVTYTQNVNVNLSPISAKFSVKTDDVVTGESLTFANTSSNATSYSWNFGDGTTSTSANPSHTYTDLGTYTVKLTATSKAGSSSVTKNVAVTLLPVSAKFSVKTSDVVTGESLTFANTSSNATSYSWNFGDGTTSTGANPTHAYTDLGTYTVKLTAISKAGTSSATQNVAVTLLPVSANFSVKTADVVTGESLAFSNTSSNATSYSWSFGDGTTSTLDNPTHAFTELGSYEVVLTATSKAGTKTATENVVVSLLPVSAKFSVKTTDVVTGETLTFNNTSANATSYSWDFGDGSTSTDVNPTHVYTELGTFTVELTASSKAGTKKTSTNVEVNLEPVIADFASDQTEVFTEESIQFTNVSLAAESFSWDFGDGNVSTEKNPTHKYAAKGSYIVVLTASSKAGKSTKNVSILVKEEIVVIPDPDVLPAEAIFTVNKSNDILMGEELVFNNSSKNATQYRWDFGDGITSSEKNPTHSFVNTGEYTVVLQAINSDSLSITQQVINVNIEPVQAGFSLSVSEIFEGETIDFTNTSQHATSYSWSFGDGELSELENPSHTYAISGTYNVELVAQNKASDANFSTTITVLVKPAVAQFTASENEVFIDETVSFTNNSIQADSYAWEFGDGTTSEVKDPTHAWLSEGTYTVTLKAINRAGESISTTIIQVTKKPVVIVPPVNNAPVAIAQSLTTDYNTNISVALTASDSDNDALQFIISEAPVNGSLLGEAPNLTYVPNENFSGMDAFKFMVSDSDTVSNVAVVRVEVYEPDPEPTPEPDSIAPKAASLSLITAFETSLNVTITATDSESDNLSYSIVDVPTNGTLQGEAPNLIYTPNNNFSGDDAFTFIARDTSNTSNIATVHITVEDPEEKSSLLGYWSFDEGEGNIAVDKSGNNYNGNLINGEWKELGLVNGSVEFDGTTYVELDEHVDTFSELSQGAISLWFKTDAEDAGRLLTASNSEDFSSDLVVNCKDGFINYAVRDNNAAKLVVRSQFNTYNDNEWHHVVININKASNQVFVDGEPIRVSYIVGTASSSEFFASVSNLDVMRIGNGEDKNNGNEDFYIGLQDEVKIYTIPLTEEEIKQQYDFVIANLPGNTVPVAISKSVQVVENYTVEVTLEGSDFNEDELTYTVMEFPLHGELIGEAPNLTYKPNEGFVGEEVFTFIAFDGVDESSEATINITVVDYELAESLSEGLIAHWALNDNSGSAARDLSGNDYDGIVYNEKWLKNGKVDGAVSFNGKGYVDLDQHVSAVQDLSTGAISLWFKTTVPNAGRLFTVADKGDKSSDIMLDVFGGQINYTVRENDKLKVRITTQQNHLNDGEWHHVAINVDEEGCVIFLDGNIAEVYYTEGTAATSYFFSAVSDVDVMRIGNGEDADHGNEDYFKGSFDDVRLYNRTLEDAEVESLIGSATDDTNRKPYLKEINLTGISTWPNPAVNYVNIDFPDEGNFRVSIYNVKGKLMYLTDVKDNKTHAIGIGQYDIGMYFIKVVDLDTDEMYTESIIKREL